MPLNDDYLLAVTFIVAPSRQGDGKVVNEPIGTGFIVNVPTRFPDLSFEYIVTAGHVVEGVEEIHARIRTRDGHSRDLPAPEWLQHPKGDVAAAPFISGGYDDLHLKHVPAAGIAERAIPGWKPDLGDRVYFLGLLALPGAKGLTERNVPMVRSGTIGAMYQPDMPHKWPDGTTRRMEAHLIDCRSYQGFSGSPCFYQGDNKFTGVREGVVETGSVTLMLGLVSGHLDTQDRVNTGVGLIAPAERIVEVLLMEELKEERERVARERKAKQDEEGATLDAAEGESEFERFERLARHVVKVPKPDTKAET